MECSVAEVAVIPPFLDVFPHGWPPPEVRDALVARSPPQVPYKSYVALAFYSESSFSEVGAQVSEMPYLVLSGVDFLSECRYHLVWYHDLVVASACLAIQQFLVVLVYSAYLYAAFAFSC